MEESLSWEECLRCLVLDPFPTKQFREIMSYLKDLQIILEELQKSRTCCVPGILEKLALKGTKAARSNLIPSADAQKLLREKNISGKITPLIVKLLRYIIMKLANCPDEEAATILHDFDALKSFVFVFRASPCCDKAKLDGVVAMFAEKVIKLLTTELGEQDFLEKFHLFAVMRVVIGELGKNQVYTARIIKQLSNEIKVYYEKVNALEPDIDLNVYVCERYFNFFYIIYDVIGGNIIDEIQKSDDTVLRDLYQLLKALSEKSLNKRESYLVQKILTIIDVHVQLTQ